MFLCARLQVMFQGFLGVMTRTDVTTKRLQSPWAKFKSMKWDGKTYTKGQYVRSDKSPIQLDYKIQQKHFCASCVLVMGSTNKHIFQ